MAGQAVAGYRRLMSADGGCGVRIVFLMTGRTQYFRRILQHGGIVAGMGRMAGRAEFLQVRIMVAGLAGFKGVVARDTQIVGVSLQGWKRGVGRLVAGIAVTFEHWLMARGTQESRTL